MEKNKINKNKKSLHIVLRISNIKDANLLLSKFEVPLIQEVTGYHRRNSCPYLSERPRIPYVPPMYDLEKMIELHIYSC